MIALVVRLAAVLGLLNLLALVPCRCPVCGASFMGLAPGEPCSSVCSAKQRQDRSLGGGGSKVTSKSTGEHVGGTGKNRVPGKGGGSVGGGGGARDDGGCLELALLPAAGIAVALVASLTALIRRRT